MSAQEGRQRSWSVERPHPRVVLASFLVGILMLIVGLFLAALGVKVLDLSGGAAKDTSLVVAVAAFAVADFWGGGLVTALTRAKISQVTLGWAIARGVILVLIAIVVQRMLPLVPLQLALAVVAAWAGSRMSHKQLSMRREIAAERQAADAAAAATPSGAER